MMENRRALRASTYLAGRVALDPAPGHALPCLVRNLSAIGACLILCADRPVPEDFVLFLAPGERAHRVRKIWQSGHVVGVSFAEVRLNAPDVLPDADASQAGFSGVRPNVPSIL